MDAVRLAQKRATVLNARPVTAAAHAWLVGLWATSLREEHFSTSRLTGAQCPVQPLPFYSFKLFLRGVGTRARAQGPQAGAGWQTLCMELAW